MKDRNVRTRLVRKYDSEQSTRAQARSNVDTNEELLRFRAAPTDTGRISRFLALPIRGGHSIVTREKPICLFDSLRLLVLLLALATLEPDYALADCAQYRSLTNLSDTAQFVNRLLGGTTNSESLCTADLNGDGSLDGKDVSAFVECALSAAPCEIRLEGESASGPGTNIPRSQASGNLARHVTGPTASLSFQFDGPSGVTAVYRILVRYSNDSFNGPLEHVAILVDGNLVGQFDALDSGGGGQGWNVYETFISENTMTLSPGEHSLTLSVSNCDFYGFEADVAILEKM